MYPSLRTFYQCLYFCLCLLLLAGCASSSVFRPYPAQAEQMKSALLTAGVDAYLDSIQEDLEAPDRLLYRQEAGRLAQLQGDFESSRRHFEVAAGIYEESDLAATVQVRRLGAQTGSLVTNDNAIPYRGAGYERILVHHFQAFNYLGLNDLEGAAVEFRKAALEQQFLLEQNEAEVAEAEQKAREKRVPVDDLATHFSGLDTLAGPVKVSFQNPYTFYSSGVFWEATGELNDALVDYRKALEIYPQSERLRRDVRRVSRRMGLAAGEGADDAPTPDEGTLIVLYEQDFIPPRSEFKLPLPTLDGGLISIAFPTYLEQTRVPLQPVTVAVGEQRSETARIADFGAQAARHLQEQMTGMLVRQALRGWAKYELQQESARAGGALGQFAASIYNVLSESADLRSWLTLPAWGQAQRVNLEPGSYPVTIGPQEAAPVTVNIRAGRSTLLRVIDVRGRRMTQVFTL